MRTWKPRRPVVLVIDDDPDILKVLGMCLSSEGCEVHEAASATHALDMLDRVDVIVVDQRMPTMSGTEFVTAARARGFTGRVLVISSSRASRTDAIAAHADGFLAKPIGPRNLVSEVERLFFLTVPPPRQTPRASQPGQIPTKS